MDPQPVRRPAGVWILTFIVGFGAGAVPALAMVVLLVREPALLDAVGGPVVAVLSLLFSVGVIYAAIAAWRGQNAGRYELVVLAVLYYAHYAWANLTAATGGLVSPARIPLHNGRALRGVVMVVLVTWYFLANPNARRFYATHADRREEEATQLTPGENDESAEGNASARG